MLYFTMTSQFYKVIARKNNCLKTDPKFVHGLAKR